MTDNPEYYDSDEFLIDDPNSPFYGLPRGVAQTAPDPQEQVLNEVLDQLGVNSFGEVIVDFGNVDVENLRGNRFTNIVDALVYLGQAGILQFGEVTLDDEGEIGVAIDSDTGRID